MSKEEMRNTRRGRGTAAGIVEKELKELDRVQKADKNQDSEIRTITVGCGALFTVVCC